MDEHGKPRAAMTFAPPIRHNFLIVRGGLHRIVIDVYWTRAGGRLLEFFSPVWIMLNFLEWCFAVAKVTFHCCGRRAFPAIKSSPRWISRVRVHILSLRQIWPWWVAFLNPLSLTIHRVNKVALIGHQWNEWMEWSSRLILLQAWLRSRP